MRILFFGDIVGQPGRQAVRAVMPRWRSQYRPDVVLANGENAAGGKGLTPEVAEELFENGIDLLTLGNHAFAKKEVVPLLEEDDRVVRPANYPEGVPGHGYGLFALGERKLAVINLLGRVFMDPLDDPFRRARELVAVLRGQATVVVIDIHAEATSEKAALAWMLDGQVSAVLGTHTHVATADARVLPGGTAFVTDIGMVGPRDAILGVDTGPVIQKFLTGMPQRFEVAGGASVVNAVCLDVDDATGRATGITRLDEQLGG
jgi:metallophosphoesterase (TIGR00282 family)